VDDQVLVAMGGDAPVEAPFEERKRVRGRQRSKRGVAFEAKHRLAPDVPAKAGRRRDDDLEIGERVVVERLVARVMDLHRFGHFVERRADLHDQRSHPHAQSRGA